MQAVVRDDSQTQIIKMPVSSEILDYINDIENLMWKDFECNRELTSIEEIILTKYYISQLKEALRLHMDSAPTQYRFRHLDQIKKYIK